MVKSQLSKTSKRAVVPVLLLLTAPALCLEPGDLPSLLEIPHVVAKGQAIVDRKIRDFGDFPLGTHRFNFEVYYVGDSLIMRLVDGENVNVVHYDSFNGRVEYWLRGASNLHGTRSFESNHLGLHATAPDPLAHLRIISGLISRQDVINNVEILPANDPNRFEVQIPLPTVTLAEGSPDELLLTPFHQLDIAGGRVQRQSLIHLFENLPPRVHSETIASDFDTAFSAFPKRVRKVFNTFDGSPENPIKVPRESVDIAVESYRPLPASEKVEVILARVTRGIPRVQIENAQMIGLIENRSGFFVGITNGFRSLFSSQLFYLFVIAMTSFLIAWRFFFGKGRIQDA